MFLIYVIKRINLTVGKLIQHKLANGFILTQLFSSCLRLFIPEKHITPVIAKPDNKSFQKIIKQGISIGQIWIGNWN